MTGLGKILVFLNLIAAAALLSWGLSAYTNSPQWLDGKDADGGAIEGEISRLKKEIDRYSKAANGTSETYVSKSAALAGVEATRDIRAARLSAWLTEAKSGAFYPLPMQANDATLIDVSQAADTARKRTPILGPDNAPLKGLDALQKLYQNELDDAKLLREGKMAAQPAEWMDPKVLLAPARINDLGVYDLRRLHAWVSAEMKITDVAIDKQRVIQANLSDETAYLGDARINWTARLQVLESRNKQLKDALTKLGSQ